jgi:hypothetical protein
MNGKDATFVLLAINYLRRLRRDNRTFEYEVQLDFYTNETAHIWEGPHSLKELVEDASHPVRF